MALIPTRDRAVAAAVAELVDSNPSPRRAKEGDKSQSTT